LKLLGIGAGAAAAVAVAAFSGNTPAGPRPVRDVERGPKPYTGPVPKSDYIKDRPAVIPPIVVPPLTPPYHPWIVRSGDVDLEQFENFPIQPGNLIYTSGTSHPDNVTLTTTCDIKT